MLAIFNMFPLPPLNGGRVAVGLLPNVLAQPLSRLGPYGMLILIGAIFILSVAGDQLGISLDIFNWAVSTPVAWLLPFFKGIAGIGLVSRRASLGRYVRTCPKSDRRVQFLEMQ